MEKTAPHNGKEKMLNIKINIDARASLLRLCKSIYQHPLSQFCRGRGGWRHEDVAITLQANNFI